MNGNGHLWVSRVQLDLPVLVRKYREVERPFVDDEQIQDDARSVGKVFPPCSLFSYLTFSSDRHEAR